MLYHHTPRFQSLLQAALRVAARERGYSDEKMIRDAKLFCKKSTLARFRTSPALDFKKLPPEQIDLPIDRVAGAFLNSRDAANLWKHLDADSSLLETVIGMNHGNSPQTSLYPISEVANAFLSFYAVHKSSIKKFVERGIHGNFFCYKPSFRRPGFVVKSRLKLDPIGNDFFHIEELQRTSEIFELDQTEIIESSEGFGFIKSDRLWLFLRDIETEQPRVFCFYKPKFARPKHENTALESDSLRGEGAKNLRIVKMEGYLIEGAKGNENDVFRFNVMLYAEDVEQNLWHLEHPDLKFNPDNQVDIYPATPEQKRRYSAEMKKKVLLIPRDVIEYLAADFERQAPAPST